MKKVLFLLLVLLGSKGLYSANYYWRATATNNLFTNVGNWETAPGNLITPGVAPTSGDSVFFPVTSNFSSINLNGGNCGVLTVTAPTLFTFTGTGNFYGDINANGNIRFNGTVNFQGLGTKNINLDPNPNTSVYYFNGGSIICNSGTINLNHNLLTTSTINLTNTLTRFNSNSYDIDCGNLRIGNAATAIYDFTNSKVRTTNITYYTTNASNLLFSGVRLFVSRTTGNVFYSYGNAPLTFQSLTVEGTGNIQWYANNLTIRMDSLTVNQATVFDITNVFGGTWYIDSVLKFKSQTLFSANTSINIFLDTIETLPLCYGQSVFKEFKLNTTSPITINTIAFNTINFLGVGLTSSITNNVVNNSGAGITWTGPLTGQTFHWVGGDGDWSDPTEWSLLGSGGVPQLSTGCVPTYADSVVFDDNSFTSVGEIVNTVGLQAKCKSITNIDTGNEGAYNGSVSIAGDANFTGALAVNSIELVGKGNQTLTSGTNFSYSGVITVNCEGNYTLLDSVLSNSSFYHSSGGLNFNGFSIDVTYFQSITPNGVSGGLRTIDMSNATLRTKSGLYIGAGKLTSINSINSKIIVSNPNGQAKFRSGPAPNLSNLQLNDIYFTATTGTGDIYTDNPIVAFNDVYFSSHGKAGYKQYNANTLNLTAGKIYTFAQNHTYTIYTGINTSITACNDLATIKSSSGQAKLYKASLPFTTSGLISQGINATGATLTINNGVDLGNNTNVTIAPGIGRDMYWVNGSGNWDDGYGHWSIGVSGGNPATTNPSGCIPRPIDNVFFDTNSFNGSGQIVTLNIDANCKDMIWDSNAASFSPVLSGAPSINLDVYGSLRFSTGMVHNHTGKTNFRGVLTGVNNQTIHTDDVLIKTQMYFLGGGRYDIIHDISGNTNSRFFFNRGHLYTNSHDITVGIMYLELPLSNSADISNSNINLTVYTGYRGNHYSSTNFNAAGSSITVPQFFYPNVQVALTDTIKYNNVTITGGGAFRNNNVIGSPVSFNRVSFGGSNAMDGTFIIDTLIYKQSTNNTLDPAGFYSILDTLVADGTPCVPITLRSSVVNNPVGIKSGSCNFDIQFGNIQDMVADLGSGCTGVGYRVFGNDAGGNANWNFVIPPSTNQLGNDTTVYCTEAPYTINTDGFGSAPATYLWNTGETTKTIEVDTGGVYSVYVTYTAGCIAFDTVVVTILDTVAPVLTCPLDSTVYLNGICQYVLGDFTDSVAVDDCTPDSALILTQLPLPGTVYSGESIQTIWIYAEDNYGNIDSCSFQLTLLDTLNPLVTCKDTTVYLNALGTYSIDTSYVFANASDNCGVDSIWITPTNYTCVDTGLNIVTLYVRDNNNNVDSCTANVTVLDTLNPLVTCKDTTVYLNTLGTYSIDTSYVFVNASDNCGVDSIWITTNTFNCTNTGLNTVTVYARDNNNNVDSCIANVTLLDTLTPLVTCQDTTIYLTTLGTYSIDTSYVFANVSDNCGIDSIWITTNTFNCADTGVNTVIVYARDVNNNVDSCIANVTVLDTINPLVTCQDTTIYLNASGTYTIDTSYVFANASDNCGVDSIWIITNTFSCADTGLNTVTVYLRDNNNNVDSCIANVTVLDTINPIVTCKDTTIYLNTLGTYTIDTSYVFVNANDNCGVDSIWITTNTFNCTNTGLNTVTVYARDNNNNIDSCIANVTVLDTLNPIVTCQDTTIYLNASGTYTIDTSYVFANASDICGVDSIWITTNTFNCADTGVNTVTVYARDNNNNVDSCVATLTVLDTLNPIVTCQDTTIYLNATGTYAIDTSYVFANASDNCGIDSIWIIINTFSCADTGLNTVTVYVRDNNNNLDSCIANVTVLDTINPIVVCNDTTIYLDVTGQYTIDTSYVFTNASDNCGVDSIWINTIDTLFTCSNIGTTQVILYVRDASGNIDSCVANVTVMDTLAPIVICQDTTIYLSPAGTYTIDTSYVLANVMDNCTLDSVWLTPASFTCADTGLNIVTIYARDVNNNIDSCISSVTALDTVNPTISCQNATVYLDTNGQFIIDTSYVYSSAFAGCGLDSIWIVDSVFDCSRIGVNTVSVYARDINGNVDSCQAQVTVLDTVTPQITCGSTLYDTVSNSCEYIVPDFRTLTLPTDNCTDSINFQITQVPAPGTVITVQDQQIETITITVTDTNGNSTVCMFDVELTCSDEFQIPEFISPNGDGKNDTWIITGIEAYPNNNVKVFNRYGAMVYQTNGYHNQWDGTANVDYIFQSGESDNILPSGTYFYRLELDVNNKKSDIYRGMIQLNK